MEKGKWAYRMIGESGVFDVHSMNMDRLIKLAAHRTGMYHLYQWTGTYWSKLETFIF